MSMNRRALLSCLTDARVERRLEPRVESEALGEVAFGFVVPAEQQPHQTALRPEAGALRAESDRLIQVGVRAPQVALIAARGAAVAPGGREARVEFDGPAVIADRGVEFLLRLPGVTPAVVRHRVSWVERDGLIEVRDGLVEPRRAAVVPGFGLIGLEFDGFGAGADGLVVFPEQIPHYAGVVPGAGELRVEGDGESVVLNRARQVTLLLPLVAAVVIIAGGAGAH